MPEYRRLPQATADYHRLLLQITADYRLIMFYKCL